MSATLSKDAKLGDLLALLDNPEGYVREVFGVMHAANKAHGDIVVRLGVTGTGKFPNYRIEPSQGGEPIFAVDGANHKRWPEGENFGDPANWSSSTMSTDQVRDLLGDIRNYRR